MAQKDNDWDVSEHFVGDIVKGSQVQRTVDKETYLEHQIFEP